MTQRPSVRRSARPRRSRAASTSSYELPVRVGASRTGRGVFAGRHFRSGQYVSRISGRIIDDPEYSSDYCMELGHKTLEPDAPFRYLNHSCQPNCTLVWEPAPHDRRAPIRLYLQALVPIAEGSELTIDYAWPASAAIRCGCASPQCRGWIVAPDELARVEAARRAGY